LDVPFNVNATEHSPEVLRNAAIAECAFRTLPLIRTNAEFPTCESTETIALEPPIIETSAEAPARFSSAYDDMAEERPERELILTAEEELPMAFILL
jgi:hypothetical protein